MGPIRLLPLVLLPLLLLASSGPGWQRLLPPPIAPVVEPPAAPLPPTPQDLLAARGLLVPVQGVPRHKLRDSYDAHRGKGRRHRAIDIMAPHGTPVLAADDGRVEKISRNRAGGLTLYQVDASGQFVYYYAHLDGYVGSLREGQVVKRGDMLGYVGQTGNATTPHLHFQVMLMARERRWWGGEPINPFAALAQETNVMGAGASVSRAVPPGGAVPSGGAVP